MATRSPRDVLRGRFQKLKDFVTFPLRAVTVMRKDRWGFSSLRSERFDYVAREVLGYCLDIGCGEQNLFVTNCLGGNGKGIDVFPYEGLTAENVVEDMEHLPFNDNTFHGNRSGCPAACGGEE